MPGSCSKPPGWIIPPDSRPSKPDQAPRLDLLGVPDLAPPRAEALQLPSGGARRIRSPPRLVLRFRTLHSARPSPLHFARQGAGIRRQSAFSQLSCWCPTQEPERRVRVLKTKMPTLGGNQSIWSRTETIIRLDGGLWLRKPA